MAASCPRLVRTFSSSNDNAASQIHQHITRQGRMQTQDVNLEKDVTKSSMILPTVREIMLERSYDLAKYIISCAADVENLELLERDRIINWCPYARTLIPFNTDSDGNCLMHALSIYVWGVHDRRLSLRGFLHRKLQRALKDGDLYLRWKNAKEESLGEIQTSLPSIAVSRDWDAVVNVSSSIEFPIGNRGQKYSPLENIHIFATSNILARPIIVLSEKVQHGSTGASLLPNQNSGIYLPLLRNPNDCEKSPIVIGYMSGHFVPLLSGEDMDLLISSHHVHPDSQHCIPLVYSDVSDIPIHFMMANETRDFLLYQYMDCFIIPVVNEVLKPAASLRFKAPPAWSVELMLSLYSTACKAFYDNISLGTVQDKNTLQRSERDDRKRPATGNVLKRPLPTPISKLSTRTPKPSTVAMSKDSNTRKCAVAHCTNGGKLEFNDMCESCCRDRITKRPVAVSRIGIQPSPTSAAQVGQLTKESLGTLLEAGYDIEMINEVQKMGLEKYGEYFDSVKGTADAIVHFLKYGNLDELSIPDKKNVNYDEEVPTDQKTASSNDKQVNLKDELEKLRELHSCKICMDEKVGAAFHPCGHLCTCSGCAKKLQQCPLCRANIESTLRVYLS